MTACIVGWAHTAFGRLEGETVESLIVRVATRRWRMPASPPATSTRSCSATSTPASRRRILPPRWCCRPRPTCASSARPGSRTPAPPARPPCTRLNSIAAKAARIVLVVGAEQMTDAGTRDRAQPAQGVLRARGGRHRRRLRRHLSPDRRSLFPALGRPVGRWRASPPRTTRMASAIRTRRSARTRLRFRRTESDKNPRVAGPLKRTDCSLVSDGAAAVVLADVTTALRLGKAVAFRRRARAGFPADVEARRAQARRLRARLETRAGGRRRRAHRPVVRRDP